MRIEAWFSVCALLAFLWVPQVVTAQDRSAPVEFIVRDLPSVGGLPRVIDGASIDSFRPILPVELFELFSMGVTIEAFKEIPFPWRYDDDWIKNSVVQPQGDPQGITAGSFVRGFPYGSADLIDREQDPVAAARKILWNVSSHTLMQRMIGVDLRYAVTKDWTEEKIVQARLLRAYPGTLQSENKTNQVLREMLTITSPTPLAGLARMTFRFFGDEEDVVWGYSPAIQKTRQLAGSNRSDPFLFTGVSLDDLFTWSGKVEWVEPRLEDTVTVLAPFSQNAMVRATMHSASCLKIENGGAPTEISFNVGTKRYADALPWTPTGSYFVPRRMWRITLTNGDPFSRYGRQVLYVDRESQLPIYKIVYGPSGEPLKGIFSSFQLAGLDDRSHIFSAPAYTVVVDFSTKNGSVVEYSGYGTCSAESADFNLGTLDPRRMAAPQPDGSL